MQQRDDFDAVVIGSGFGGSVLALRLAEAGHAVAVLERGRWWRPEDFPRRPIDLWKAARTPITPDGLYDARRFDGVTVYAANGVGGGSLVSSNVLARAPRGALEALPPGLRSADLEPRFERVLRMLGAAPARPQPGETEVRKAAVLRELAARVGPRFPKARWKPLDLAVNFDRPRELPTDLDGYPHAGRRSEVCIGCGDCNFGCHVLAKNTLDLTYLPAAMRAGARVLDRCEVERIEPLGRRAASPGASPGYRVHFRDRNRSVQRALTARRVVLAAGAIGSTELLLRGRAEGFLPRLSSQIGRRFSVTGDVLVHAYAAAAPTGSRAPGPIIASGIEFPAEGEHGCDILVEDTGFPPLAMGFLPRTIPYAVERLEGAARSLLRGGVEGVLGAARGLARGLLPPAVDERSLALAVMGRDAADGVASLDAQGRLAIRWSWNGSRDFVARANEVIAALVEAAGARIPPEPIRLDGRAQTVHPLGGCPIGEDPSTGVVSPAGEVFGYPGLFVADGSIVPVAVGANPSLTIAGLAEAIADGAARGR